MSALANLLLFACRSFRTSGSLFQTRCSHKSQRISDQLAWLLQDGPGTLDIGVFNFDEDDELQKVST